MDLATVSKNRTDSEHEQQQSDAPLAKAAELKLLHSGSFHRLVRLDETLERSDAFSIVSDVRKKFRVE